MCNCITFTCFCIRNIWADRQVPVKHVQHCHLVEYQQQLLSMVLSHCQYTLNHEQDQQLTYEFAALQKRFVDRFIHGRPTIKFEIMEVKYREEAYSIANVKRAVEPKVSIKVCKMNGHCSHKGIETRVGTN